VRATHNRQRHRHNDCLTAPPRTAGFHDNTPPAPARPELNPATITAADPTTGHAAASPGQATSVVSTTPEATTATRPTQPSTTPTTRGNRPHHRAPIATNAPTPSSHNRVGVTKNAASGLPAVYTTEKMNEGTITTPIPTPITGNNRA